MSEPKAMKFFEAVPTSKAGFYQPGAFVDGYLKSEADKVIAEKDEKIDELEEYIDELKKATDSAWGKVNAMYDELRHQKYKRCLAMAAVCFEKSYSTTLVKYDKESGLLRNFYDWWGKRWLALAEEPTWAKFLQLIHKETK